MIDTRSVCHALLLVLTGVAHAEPCVEVRAGTALREPGTTIAIGKAERRFTAAVVERGDWLTLRIDKLDEMNRMRFKHGELSVAVPRKATRAARCPAGANAGELGLLTDTLELRWKDGGKAGWTQTVDGAAAARASTEKIELDGAPHVCFDYAFAEVAKVHVCGACERLRQGDGPGLGETRRPCD